MLSASSLPRRALVTLAAGVLAAPAIHAEEPAVIRFGGTGGAMGGIRLLEPMLAQAGIVLHHVRRLGSAGGFRAVRAGIMDVSVAAQVPSPGEAQVALRSVLYARSPLVFATHPATAAESLTRDELVGMIAGRITHWPEGLRVRLSRRPDQDNDTQLVASLSPAMAAAVASMQQRPGVVTAGSDHEQAAALEAVPGTLGALALSLILSEEPPLKVLELRDPPASGWPLLKPFHLVTRAEPSPAVQRFAEILLSEAASRILSAKGHLPVTAAAA